MINFIIYEDDDVLKEIYKSVIRRFMGNLIFEYDIYEFKSSNKEIDDKVKNISGKKIFLLDVNISGTLGVEIARSIRRSGDWDSQIIVITTHDQYINFGFTARLLMLDFISKFSDIEKELYFSLNVAFSILNSHAALVFRNNGEIFQVLYNDIYYIEKNLHDNDSTVVTKDNKYIIKSSINKIMKKLSDDPRFFKSHRSCIINLNNIVSFDMNRNVVKFKVGEIDLISRERRKDLKERLLNYKINQ